MKIFEFGCAPDAKKEGFNSPVQVVHGTLEQVEKAHDGEDVAVVYGARHSGSGDVFEFGVFSRLD